MIQSGHGVYLLNKTFLELRVLNHLLFGQAFDRVVAGRRGGFGNKQDVTETPFAYFSYAIELARV
jgi:hypothetical protein